jgi:hypothetical protein
LENITDELVDTVKIDIKKTVYNLTKQIAYKLKATPNARTDEEIQSACIIIDAYIKNDTNPPTQLDTPLPIPIPIQNIPTKDFEIKNVDHFSEGLNLINFMNHHLPVNKTTVFKPPTSFTTMIKDGEKDKNLWDEILEEIFNKKAVDTKYCGRTVYYLQFGPPHAPHFMGCNFKDQFIIASSKKELFSRMGA